MKPNLSSDFTRPAWLPDAVRLYLEHTGEGLSIRALARREGAHASTVMRMVRRCELRREDPLVDTALAEFEERSGSSEPGEDTDMNATQRNQMKLMDDATLIREGCRILRRLAEPGAILAVAAEMDKAAVLREFPDGKTARTGVVDRNVAQAFALKDWITCRKQGKISAYEITPVGRAALKRMLDSNNVSNRNMLGLSEAATPFADQHRVWDDRGFVASDDQADKPKDGQRRIRYNLAESPISLMGRRRDKDGKPFLEADLVRAGERLREDFEIGQMGPRVAQNWERFLTGTDRCGLKPEAERGEGSSGARDRVAAALRDLGPGLGDVALRVCCFLEGIEATEKRMGWAARSGKIVLRIALQRLKRHYDDTYGPGGRLIG